jgi:hypothetical protein
VFFSAPRIGSHQSLDQHFQLLIDISTYFTSSNLPTYTINNPTRLDIIAKRGRTVSMGNSSSKHKSANKKTSKRQNGQQPMKVDMKGEQYPRSTFDDGKTFDYTCPAWERVGIKNKKDDNVRQMTRPGDARVRGNEGANKGESKYWDVVDEILGIEGQPGGVRQSDGRVFYPYLA